MKNTKHTTHAGHGMTHSIDTCLSLKTMNREGQTPLAYYAGGTGPETLVIINAFGQSLAFWDLLVADLVPRYRLLIWQPRGAGPRDGTVQQAFPLDEHVQDLLGILDAAKVAQAHLIGWHTAPKTAIAFFAHHPHRVASLTAMSSCFTHDVEHRPPASRYEQGLHTLCKLVLGSPHLAAKAIDALRGLLESQEPHGRIAGHADTGPELDLISHIKSLVFEPFRTPQSVLAYAAQLTEFWKCDISAILPAITVPTLFLDGEFDYIVDADSTRTAAATVPGAICARVRGGTHFMQCDSHRAVSEILSCFVEKQHLGGMEKLLMDFNPEGAASMLRTGD